MKTLLAVVIVSAVAFAPPAARATSFIQRPFANTVQDAPVIVRGKIGGSKADYGVNSEGVRSIYTYYELQAEEVIKGNAGTGTLNIRELGGEKDGVGMSIPGASQFQRGEDVVVMLGERNRDGSYDVYGLMMGKLNVRQNESGKDVLSGPALMPSAHDLENAEGHGGPVSAPETTLGDLREIVRKQGGTAPPSTPEVEKNASSSAPKGASSPSPAPSKAGDLAAPQLQNSPAGGSGDAPAPAASDSGLSPGWIVAGLAALLAVPIGFVLLRARRK